MKIYIHNQTNFHIDNYEKTLKKVFKTIKDNKNIHIIFVDLKEIRRLNSYYRDIDHPTDVLSFENHDDKKTNGDIFISVPKVVEQAKEYGHSELREVSFLAVHGYLHLKGYDHQTKEEETIMHELTEQILVKSKLGRVKNETRN